MDRINWQRTRDILICIICLGVIFWAAWNFFGQFVDAIVILLLSMAVAFLLTPAVNLLSKLHIPRVLSVFITYIAVVGVIVGIAYALVASLIQQVNNFSATIITFANSLSSLPTQKQTLEFLNTLRSENVPVDSVIAQIQSQVSNFALAITANAWPVATNLFSVVLNILLVIVLSFYLTLDGKRIRDSLVSIAPKRSLPNVLLFEDALNSVVGNYIRGQLTLALVVGVATSVICLATGLGNYALICGFLAFLFETIPMVGPGLAAITPILLSLLLGGPDMLQRTLIIVGLFVVLQVIESNILGPRIVGHAVGLHPVAAILSLLVGAKLFGVFGALLATPIVAALWVVIASIYRSIRGESADQIMMRKRAPWSLRRPHDNHSQTKRTVDKNLYEKPDEAESERQEPLHTGGSATVEQ
ncbi:MAG TPA: AI-2E family transporter [Dictyobacter sp.]|jgi:predicted PurR-regulated permease PerM|nr:AI-2E family transporter [Dictyobacter sp.]